MLDSFESWECVAEIGDDHRLILIARVQIRGREVQLVDDMRVGPDGMVVEFTVYARPLAGSAMLASVAAPKSPLGAAG